MSGFHDDKTGEAVQVDPKQIVSYGPNWTTLSNGTSVRLADGTRLTLGESFAAFHRWLYPAKSEGKG